MTQETAEAGGGAAATPLTAETQRYFMVQDYKEGKRAAPDAKIERGEDELEFLLASARDHVRTLRPDNKTDCECMMAFFALLQRSEPGQRQVKLAEEFLSRDWRGRTIRPELYHALHRAITLLGKQGTDEALGVLKKVARAEFWEARAWRALAEPAVSETETRQELILRMRAWAGTLAGARDPATAEALLSDMAREAPPGTFTASVIALAQTYVEKVKRGESVDDFFPVP
ncbi:MAG: hypothetical protein JXR94_15160 [Candidatus Hydrogenedentes bacterium]|nr:hypothetical protein [Candidatus Hydrogenedentota bacterium]